MGVLINHGIGVMEKVMSFVETNAVQNPQMSVLTF